MLALLLVALAAAPLPPGTISTDGRVATPEGIRFRLPPRFTYRAATVDGDRAYVAVAPDQGSVVIVAAALSDSELPCGAQEGVEVRAYRTASGLVACLVEGGAADGGGMAIAWVKRGDVLVGVTAIGEGRAVADLARTVADSVQVESNAAGRARLPVVNVPKPEPRLVGCFEQSFGMSFGGGFTRASWDRCFRADLTFTETSIVNSSTEHRDPISGDPEGRAGATMEGAGNRGTWRYEDGVLTLAYEDGSEAEWTITFSDTSDNVFADGKLWERY